MYIFHVFYAGPHGRIADRLNVFIPSENIVDKDNDNNMRYVEALSQGLPRFTWFMGFHDE